MKRRTLAIGGIAAAGLAAGAGVAAWRLRTTGEAQAPDGFWTMRFEQPAGGEVTTADHRGKPLLLNFWATWCAPCITELPLLAEFQQRQAGRWRVLALAIDSPSAVREFLTKRPLGLTFGLAGLDGVELSRQLGNPSGSLPFTVVFDSAGRIQARKLGLVKPPDLDGWTKAVS